MLHYTRYWIGTQDSKTGEVPLLPDRPVWSCTLRRPPPDAHIAARHRPHVSDQTRPGQTRLTSPPNDVRRVSSPASPTTYKTVGDGDDDGSGGYPFPPPPHPGPLFAVHGAYQSAPPKVECRPPPMDATPLRSSCPVLAKGRLSSCPSGLCMHLGRPFPVPRPLNPSQSHLTCSTCMGTST